MVARFFPRHASALRWLGHRDVERSVALRYEVARNFFHAGQFFLEPGNQLSRRAGSRLKIA